MLYNNRIIYYSLLYSIIYDIVFIIMIYINNLNVLCFTLYPGMGRKICLNDKIIGLLVLVTLNDLHKLSVRGQSRREISLSHSFTTCSI